ncbi:hypothetical protein [Streptomyces dengpaensis]|uniref:hypothetical protein n=1 Tax=Streptomyces dengpaensis TaxID=2049881 RepID=UPI0023E8C98D|nr:hypothetical protein [Streptomyces dengpaensis]
MRRARRRSCGGAESSERDLKGHHHHVVEDHQQRREALRRVVRVRDPQRQPDLEHGVVEEEDALGGDVREVGAIAPGPGRSRRTGGVLRRGDRAGGRRWFAAARGDEGDGDEREGVAHKEPLVRRGGADGEAPAAARPPRAQPALATVRWTAW